SRPHVALLPTPVEQRLDRSASGESEGADAERTTDLVCGDADGGCSAVAQGDGQVPVGRDSVNVHGYPVGCGERREFLDGLDGAHLVVGPEEGEEGDVVVLAKRRFYRGELNPTHGVDREPFDQRALMRCEPLDRVDRRV